MAPQPKTTPKVKPAKTAAPAEEVKVISEAPIVDVTTKPEEGIVTKTDEFPDETKTDTPEVKPAETAAPAEEPGSGANDIMTIGEDNTPANVTSVSLEINQKEVTQKDDSVVAIVIGYPEDYKGDKFFKDGDEREVAISIAEQFVKKGIAKYKDA